MKLQLLCLLPLLVSLAASAKDKKIKNSPKRSDDYAFASKTCQATKKSMYEIGRTKCKNGECEVVIRLLQNKRTLDQTKNNDMYVPSGKIEKSSDTAWMISYPKEKGKKGPQAKTTLTVSTKGKMGKHNGLMVTITSVDGTGLPSTAYQYYNCSDNKLRLVWQGSDTGSEAQAKVVLKDVDKDGLDEIEVSGSSFSTGSMDTGDFFLVQGKALFKWNTKTHKMVMLNELAKKKQNPSPKKSTKKKK